MRTVHQTGWQRCQDSPEGILRRQNARFSGCRSTSGKADINRQNQGQHELVHRHDPGVSARQALATGTARIPREDQMAGYSQQELWMCESTCRDGPLSDAVQLKAFVHVFPPQLRSQYPAEPSRSEYRPRSGWERFQLAEEIFPCIPVLRRGSGCESDSLRADGPAKVVRLPERVGADPRPMASRPPAPWYMASTAARTPHPPGRVPQSGPGTSRRYDWRCGEPLADRAR